MSLKFGFSSKDVIGDGKVTQEEINVFTKWLTTRLDLPNYTEEQIINFYLACDKEEEATKSTMIAYNSLRNSTPQIFSKRDLEDKNLKKFLPVINYSVLPKRMPDGSAVIFVKLIDTYYYNYDFAEYVKMVFMVCDAAIYDYPPTSFIMIVDFGGMGFMHLTRLKLNLIQKGAQYLQSGLPVKLNNIHLINTNYVVLKFLGIVKPFLSEKVANMIISYSCADTPNIHKVIPKDCLPLELGGNLPSIDVLGQDTLNKLRSMKPHFDTEERQREPFKK